MILSFADGGLDPECKPLMKRLAPAKINLSLRVLGRREDGFHDIDTLIVPLSLADEITVERAAPGGGLRFTCSDPSLPVGPENLAYRAAEIFCARAGVAADYAIDVTKHIPHGAGLGGGSSDGATVLLTLNELLGQPLTLETLVELAAQLGSDVPAFIYRQAVRCRGRGEIVERAEFRERLPLLLLKPPFPVPTPWAYKHWRDSVEMPGAVYAPQPFAWGELVNDLERPVFEKYLPLAALKTWLLAQPGVAGALMSGSGSTVFAVLADSSAAEDLAARAREFFGELWTCACSTSRDQTTQSERRDAVPLLD